MSPKKTAARRLADIEARIDADEGLTDAQRAEIKERARQHVKTKQIERLTDELFAKEVRIAEVEYADEGEELVEVTIDLPEFAYNIVMDGVAYFHSCTYDVSRKKYLSMIDQMARSWEHNREIHGQRRKGDIARDPFNRGANFARETTIRPGGGNVTTRESLRQSLRR
jgi:hypothetical protein